MCLRMLFQVVVVVVVFSSSRGVLVFAFALMSAVLLFAYPVAGNVSRAGGTVSKPIRWVI